MTLKHNKKCSIGQGRLFSTLAFVLLLAAPLMATTTYVSQSGGTFNDMLFDRHAVKY